MLHLSTRVQRSVVRLWAQAAEPSVELSVVVLDALLHEDCLVGQIVVKVCDELDVHARLVR